MGLGRTDNNFQSTAGRTDWKARINTPADAVDMLRKFHDMSSKDPNGELIIDGYCRQKMTQMQDYIAHCKTVLVTPTFKEFLRCR